MFIAEEVKLPIPYELKERWIQQMVDFADKDEEQLYELAQRDRKDGMWIRETAIRALQVAGYIPFLRHHPKYELILRDVPEKPSKAA